MNTCNICIIGSVNDNRVTTAVNGLIMTPFNTYNKVYMTQFKENVISTCIKIAIYDIT